MARSSVIFTALIAAFVLFFLGLGLFHYEYRWQIMRFPLAVGTAIVLFCIASIAAEIRGARARAGGGGAPPAEEDLAGPRMNLRRDATGMVWMLAILPTIFLFGYVAGLPLYVFVYLKTHGQGWLASAIYAAATLAVVYLGFYKLLSVPLPVMPLEFR
ncbi:MAG TPA: tripartite tricarboxylate transporter TctB family protein [Hyphomicrobiales bacterium]|nr:tripartite tricarboxylate transporter TctB family protein [Hyphomicrobiales bacterium]